MAEVQPRDPKGQREGFTTGACAAAAAKAAARVLARGAAVDAIETTLPNGHRVTFPLKRCDREGSRAVPRAIPLIGTGRVRQAP